MAELAAAPTAGFEHSAAFYAADDEYADAVLGFVAAGLNDGDRVFVAVPEPKLSLLRDRLGGRASKMRFADMTELGANPAWIIPRVREFLDARPGRPVRYVGEPIWATRTAAELSEATRHEALLNRACPSLSCRRPGLHRWSRPGACVRRRPGQAGRAVWPPRRRPGDRGA
jgi:MEDS: MEthanogen/methylotroph, DcmR Sensory domain